MRPTPSLSLIGADLRDTLAASLRITPRPVSLPVVQKIDEAYRLLNEISGAEGDHAVLTEIAIAEAHLRRARRLAMGGGR